MRKAGISAGSLAPVFGVSYAASHHPAEDDFYIGCRFFCIYWLCCKWGQVDWLPGERGNVKFGGLSFWSPMQNTFGTKIDNSGQLEVSLEDKCRREYEILLGFER